MSNPLSTIPFYSEIQWKQGQKLNFIEEFLPHLSGSDNRILFKIGEFADYIFSFSTTQALMVSKTPRSKSQPSQTKLFLSDKTTPTSYKLKKIFSQFVGLTLLGVPSVFFGTPALLLASSVIITGIAIKVLYRSCLKRVNAAPVNQTNLPLTEKNLRSNQPDCPIINLAAELKQLIVDRLPAQSVMALSQTCREFNTHCNEFEGPVRTYSLLRRAQPTFQLLESEESVPSHLRIPVSISSASVPSDYERIKNFRIDQGMYPLSAGVGCYKRLGDSLYYIDDDDTHISPSHPLPLQILKDGSDDLVSIPISRIDFGGESLYGYTIDSFLLLENGNKIIFQVSRTQHCSERTLGRNSYDIKTHICLFQKVNDGTNHGIYRKKKIVNYPWASRQPPSRQGEYEGKGPRIKELQLVGNNIIAIESQEVRIFDTRTLDNYELDLEYPREDYTHSVTPKIWVDEQKGLLFVDVGTVTCWGLNTKGQYRKIMSYQFPDRSTSSQGSSRFLADGSSLVEFTTRERFFDESKNAWVEAEKIRGIYNPMPL